MERTLVQASRLLISVFFLFSGISKIVSLPFFDGLVAELLIGEDYFNHPTGLLWTQILTRLIISGELILGIAILQPKWLKKVVLPSIIALLVLFTAHLFYVSFDLMTQGKNFQEAFLEGNCGCFGDVLPMDNFESILKNIIAIGITFFISRKYKEDRNYLVFKPFVIPLVLGFVSMGTLALSIKDYSPDPTPEVVAVVDDGNEDPIRQENKTEAPDSVETVAAESSADSVATQEGAPQNDTEEPKEDENVATKEPQPKAEPEKDEPKETPKVENTSPHPYAKYTQFSSGTADLTKGDKLVCLFSLSCGHCQDTYRELTSIANNPNFPDTYMIVYGSEFELNYFLQQGSKELPYIRMENYTQFASLLKGKDFPKLDVLSNGQEQHFWDLESYDFANFKSYFGIKEKKKVQDSNELQIETGGSGFGW